MAGGGDFFRFWPAGREHGQMPEECVGSGTATLLRPAGKSMGSIPGAFALLFGVTSFLSAFLLFQVQLIVSKHILPWFGGTAAVWTTSLLVFQVLLLAGYV